MSSKKKILVKSETLAPDESDSAPPEFYATVMRIAVAQICQSVGFKAANRSALEILTDIAARHLQALAKSAAAVSAASAGRTEPNIFDIVFALEDLNSIQGFLGGSIVNRRLLASSTLADIVKFVKYTDETPFAKPIRKHPQLRRAKSPPNSSDHDRKLHIPRWLPAFPDTSTPEIDPEKSQMEERSDVYDEDGYVYGCLVGEKMVEDKELPAKRQRVRFKMGVGILLKKRREGEMEGEGLGVDTMSGICRGGKRISCLAFPT